MKTQFDNATIYGGDALAILKTLPSDSVHAVVTSPVYYQLCDYDHPGQYGLESSIPAYLETQVKVFAEVNRLLVEGGCCWVIIGDTMNNYSPIRGKGQRRKSGEWNYRRSLQPGYAEKECLSIPHQFQDALRESGWRLRQTLIWDKGTSGSIENSDTAPLNHEYVFQFVKWPKGGRMQVNCTGLSGSVLRYPPASDPVHPCPLPAGLVRRLILASTELGQTVLDPFCGSGVVAVESLRQGRSVVGIELNPEFYSDICRKVRAFEDSGQQLSFV